MLWEGGADTDPETRITKGAMQDASSQVQVPLQLGTGEVVVLAANVVEVDDAASAVQAGDSCVVQTACMNSHRDA